MILKTSFNKFIERISLDLTREGSIKSAHEAIRELLVNDQEIKDRYYETFLQGSYRLGTAVAPMNDGEFDVDVVLSMNLANYETGELPTANSVIKWVSGRLQENETYKEKVSVKKKCVHVQYSKGLHMDIVPAHQPNGSDNPVLVPAHWNESHPKGYRQWCIDRNNDCPHSFYSIVKMIKWWRNLKYTDKGSPKSILLTTLVGMHLPDDSKSLDEALLQTMQKINGFLEKHTTVPEIVNPSLADERLSDSWSTSDYLSFKDAWATATEKAKNAIDSEDEETTIAIWNSVELFDNTFPKTKHGEAEKLAEAMRAGTLGVTSSGRITSKKDEDTRDIRPTRYYGEK